MKPVDFGGCTFAWLETKYGRFLSLLGVEIHEQYECLGYQGYITMLLESDQYDLFIDVGAQLGLYAFVGASHCGKVIAYEASPFTMGILLFNLRHKFNVDCRYSWVGNKEQIPKSRAERLVSITRGGKDVKLKYNIPVVELDEEVLSLAVLSRKTLIKIDIEGNELNALEKCTELLKLPNVHWVIDCHYDITVEDVMTFFKDRIIYKGNHVIAVKGHPNEELDPIFNLKHWEVVKV